MKPEVPRHAAIIMDGNGRWARKRGLPRTAGHARGAETFRKIATACKDRGVEYLTVYAFSTENRKRPETEIKAIFALLGKYLDESIESMERDGISLRFLGDLSILPEEYAKKTERTDDISAKLADGAKLRVNVCFNYGAREEIVRAARLTAESGEGFSEENFEKHLRSAGLPEPDLCIRTGGERRMSNFLLWQLAYAELVFSDVLWPDFSERDLDAAFREFSGRERRYGGV